MAININELDSLLLHPATSAAIAAAKSAQPPGIPPVGGAPGMPVPPTSIPNLAAPTGAESRAAGKAEFQRGIPNVTAPPLTPDYFQQEREKSDYLKAHPWGSDVSAHPGVGGKIAHVLSRIGNVAGDIVAPRTMALIPGTDLHNQIERGGQLRGFNQAEENKLREAQTGEAEARGEQSQAEAWKALHPEDKEGWKPIGESGWEINNQGEAKQIPGFQPPTKETKKDWVSAVNPETQKPEYYDREAGKFTGVSPYEKPDEKNPPHITVMGKDGKQHIMERDPGTGEYSIDRGVAAPNYAMVAPSLKTVDVLNSQGIPTEQTLSGRVIGPAATGAYGHEEAQAGAIERAGKDLIGSITTNKGKFGNISAILNSAFLGTPLADPVSQGLAAQIGTFAALNPAMHGYRGVSAMDHFIRLIGGLPNNPDALIAGIQKIVGTAGAVNPALQTGAGAPPQGTKIRDYTEIH